MQARTVDSPKVVYGPTADITSLVDFAIASIAAEGVIGSAVLALAVALATITPISPEDGRNRLTIISDRIEFNFCSDRPAMAIR